MSKQLYLVVTRNEREREDIYSYYTDCVSNVVKAFEYQASLTEKQSGFVKVYEFPSMKELSKADVVFS